MIDHWVENGHVLIQTDSSHKRLDCKGCDNKIKVKDENNQVVTNHPIYGEGFVLTKRNSRKTRYQCSHVRCRRQMGYYHISECFNLT